MNFEFLIFHSKGTGYFIAANLYSNLHSIIQIFKNSFQISNFKLKILLLLSISFYLLAISLPSAHAANPKNTITVLPQLTQIDLAKDQPETTIYYTNNSSITIELGLSVEDVRELEDRNPVGILDPKEAANYKYSLSSWVYLDHQNVILSPGQTGSVKVTIDKEKLSSGGHYGTVLAEIHQTDESKKTVKVKGVLASLLFVRASTGNEIEEAKVPFLGPKTSGIKFPESFTFRFQNTGNVDATPYGILAIQDGNGHTVTTGIVNEDSLITLPEAIRTYTIPFKQTQKFILPGKYTAVLSLHYGKQDKKITVKTTFTTQGSIDVVLWGFGIAILLLVGMVLFKFNGLQYIIGKTYNRIIRTPRN